MKISIAESTLFLPNVCSIGKTVGTDMKRRGSFHMGSHRFGGPAKEKASVIKASRSGNQETKFNVCLFSLDANGSTRSGSPKRFHISKKTSLFTHYSISSLKLHEKKLAM